MPSIVTILVTIFAAIHALRMLVLSEPADLELLLLFAFIPARYDASLLAGGSVPGGLAADIWTFVTYAFIHGDVMHLGINAIWFLAFGSAVARRFEARRFLAFFALTAAAGAATHLALHAGEFVPMVGASAVISGCMAAAIRFVFQMGGPLSVFRRGDASAYRVPAIGLLAALRDPRILAFLGVWFGLNLLFGFGSLSVAGAAHAIAWEAHIGGFVAGLVGFAAFDPGSSAPT